MGNVKGEANLGRHFEIPKSFGQPENQILAL
jgi:hypothetical protein